MAFAALNSPLNFTLTVEKHLSEAENSMMTSTRQAFGRQRAQIEARVAQIQNTLATSPESWRSCLEPARNLIHEADTSSFVLDPRPLEEQIRLISTLQSLAYQDPDSGGEVDISSWCVRQWATVLHNHPDNLDALRGMQLDF